MIDRNCPTNVAGSHVLQVEVRSLLVLLLLVCWATIVVQLACVDVQERIHTNRKNAYLIRHPHCW